MYQKSFQNSLIWFMCLRECWIITMWQWNMRLCILLKCWESSTSHCDRTLPNRCMVSQFQLQQMRLTYTLFRLGTSCLKTFAILIMLEIRLTLSLGCWSASMTFYRQRFEGDSLFVFGLTLIRFSIGNGKETLYQCHWSEIAKISLPLINVMPYCK